MHVLWFVNAPLSPVSERLGRTFSGSGWWLVQSSQQLAREGKVRITVANVDKAYAKRDRFTSPAGVEFLMLPGRMPTTLGRDMDRMARDLAAVVHELSPDLVEVHGTEQGYGLITPLLRVPAIVNIQGLIHAVAEAPFGRHSLLGVLLRQTRSLGDLKWAAAALGLWRQLTRRRAIERQVFTVNRLFSGRTAWDEGMARRLCPDLQAYHSCPRMLRPAFFQATWDPARCDRSRLFCCSRPAPYKGMDDLLRTLAIVRQRRPDARLRITCEATGQGWAGYLRRLAGKLGLSNHVEFVGYLEEDDIARELAESGMYVHPSYVDNSPNSLAEAMCVGAPCVVSDVGGVRSMVEHERTGLLFQAGSCGQMAERVLWVLDHARPAEEMARRARETARQRHDPGRLCQQMLDIYRSVLSASGTGRESACAS